MIKSMIALGIMQFKQYNIYKSNYILWTINRLVEISAYIFIWIAIYNQTGEAGGLSLNQMVIYYVLVVTLVPLVTWGINEDMAHSIRNGKINKELLNPISYFQYWFGVNLGELAFSVIIGIITLIIAKILWSVSISVTFLNFIYFIFIILLGIPITFFLQMIVGLAGFYTNSIWGMQILRKAVISIFSGIIAPLTLFPKWFQSLSNILPFKELIYTPINVFLGQASTNDVMFSIIKLFIWAIILYIVAKIFFEHAIKKITINGG